MKFFIIFFINIFLFFTVSCSKNKEKVKKFELNENIEFNLDNMVESNSNNLDNLTYDFSKQENKIIYNVKSKQLFTSKYNQVLLTINFDIILNKVEKKDNNFIYKVYFNNLKLKHKLYYGYIDFQKISNKYQLIINSLYFNLLINNLGDKSFKIENKLALNSNLKKMAGFIFNLINYIFLEIPKEKIINNTFTINDNKYELTSEFEEDGSILLKHNTSGKKNITIESKKDFLILKSNSNKSSIRVLFSLKDKLPQKINLLFEDGDKLKFEDKDYQYSIKNYFFIERIENNK
jgi:hypothetical protein